MSLLATIAQAAAGGATDAQRTGMRESFRLLDAPEAWVIVLLVVPACAALAWLVYAREGVSPRARAFLATLRFASLLRKW
jgi:hypothetical protein